MQLKKLDANGNDLLMAKIWNTDNFNTSKGLEQEEQLLHIECKMGQPLWKAVKKFTKLNLRFSIYSP